MREYLLLLLIAVIGVSGLISIHNDVKIQSQQELILYRQAPRSHIPQAQQAGIDHDFRLVIYQGESWQDVQFRINGFQEEETFMLDVGNGKRLPLEQAVTNITYDKPGTYLIKLFKDNHLLEANEIELLDPHVIL